MYTADIRLTRTNIEWRPFTCMRDTWQMPLWHGASLTKSFSNKGLLSQRASLTNGFSDEGLLWQMTYARIVRSVSDGERSKSSAPESIKNGWVYLVLLSRTLRLAQVGITASDRLWFKRLTFHEPYLMHKLNLLYRVSQKKQTIEITYC